MFEDGYINSLTFQEAHMFPGNYVLHGSKRSYFTAKVENILHYLRIPHEFVEKQPHIGDELETRAGTGAVPVLHTPDDWVLADSTPIARLLSDRSRQGPIVPTTPRQRAAALLLEDWLDEWFPRAAIYTRWNFDESVEALPGSFIAEMSFGKPFHALDASERAQIQPMLDAALQELAPFRDMMTNQILVIGNATTELGGDIMDWFGVFLDDMATHLEQHAYLLGARPCVADFVLSGSFAAHFANDLWPRKYISKRQPVMLEWAERLWNAEAGDETWLADDALPDTLAPLLAEIGRHFAPYLCANRDALDAGEEDFELDLGHGQRTFGVNRYRELCRLDVRDELLALEPGLGAVRASIPTEVLDAYLLPPPAKVPSMAGLRNNFPSLRP